MKLGEFEQYRSQIELAMEYMRSRISSDDEPWPNLFSFKGDQRKLTAIDPSFMADWKRKNQIGQLIVKELLADGADCVVFLSDSFFAVLPKEMKDVPGNLRDLPKEYRRECLMVVVNARGKKGIFIHQPYERDQNGKPAWQPVGETGIADTNRFAFDLTEANLERAMSAPQYRGREGYDTRS